MLLLNGIGQGGSLIFANKIPLFVHRMFQQLLRPCVEPSTTLGEVGGAGRRRRWGYCRWWRCRRHQDAVGVKKKKNLLVDGGGGPLSSTLGLGS